MLFHDPAANRGEVERALEGSGVINSVSDEKETEMETIRCELHSMAPHKPLF